MRDAVTGKPFQQAQIHIDIQKWIDDHRYSIIWAPRGHGKTEQVAILRAIYCLGRNHNERLKIITNSEALSHKRLQKVKDLIQYDENLRAVYPDLEPDFTKVWSKSAIIIKRDWILTDPSLEAVGILSSGTGSRATGLIFDDVVDERNSIFQPKLRSAVKSAFYDVWMNVLEPGGWIVYISTPWHKDDLSHELVKKENFDFLEFHIDENFNPIWPGKRTKKWLVQKYQDIGSRAFDRGYRNKALSDEETVFSPDLLKRLPDYNTTIDSPIFKDKESFVGLDLARSEHGAYTVFFVITVDENKWRWVREVRRGHFNGTQVVEIMSSLNEAYNEPVFIVENNGVQQMIIDFLEIAGQAEGMGEKIVPYYTGSQKMDLLVGVPSLAVEMEKGLWKICMGDGVHPAECNCGFCAWLKELDDFPLGKFSDTIMAGFFAREGYRRSRVVTGGQFEVWDLSSIDKKPSDLDFLK